MILLLLKPLLKIFLTIAFGLFLKKRNIIDDGLQRGLNKLVSQVFSVAMVLAAGNEEFSSEISGGLLQTLIIACVFYAVSILLMRLIGKQLRTDDAHKRAFYVLGVFSNCIYFGLVLAKELYGANGLMYMLIFNLPYRILLNTYAVGTLGGGKKSLKEIVLQPLTIATLVFIILLVSPIKLPDFLQETLSSIGACMSPLAMILVGCSLAGIKFKEIFTDKYAYLVSAIRLLIAPLLMIFVLYFLPVDPVVASICVLAAAMPSAVSLLPFAEMHNCAPQFVSRAIIQSTIFMVATLPLILTLCGLAFGV